MTDCPCKHEGQRRFDQYDAWWCPGCGWRSPKCSDPECEFCEPCSVDLLAWLKLKP